MTIQRFQELVEKNSPTLSVNTLMNSAFIANESPLLGLDFVMVITSVLAKRMNIDEFTAFCSKL